MVVPKRGSLLTLLMSRFSSGENQRSVTLRNFLSLPIAPVGTKVVTRVPCAGTLLMSASQGLRLSPFLPLFLLGLDRRDRLVEFLRRVNEYLVVAGRTISEF